MVQTRCQTDRVSIQHPMGVTCLEIAFIYSESTVDLVGHNQIRWVSAFYDRCIRRSPWGAFKAPSSGAWSFGFDVLRRNGVEFFV